jgi:nucleotide-binding universal stress UspA family protein
MRILVAYDGSTSADAAIDDLRRAGLPPQGEALVVCVADGVLAQSETAVRGETQTDIGSSRSKLANAEALADRAVERIRSRFPQWTVSSEALWGSPPKIVLDTASWWQPDLLIVGSHGRSGVARFFLGSVSLELVHKAPCSVRITRMGASGENHGPIGIVIGTDGSAEAEAAIRTVAARSWPENTEVQIIAAAQTLVPVTTELEASTYAQEPAYSVIRQADEQMRLRLGNIAAESASILRRAGLIASAQVVDSDPRDAILSAAEFASADTIFVGARGLGRMERLLLGSISSYVVTHAHCSVEVVRGTYSK